jgi:hypothetical protein
MRKIEQEMVSAIRNFKDWKSGNTEVTCLRAHTLIWIHVFLHGNLIATIIFKNENLQHGKIELTNSGWATRTTHSRLNAIIIGITGLSDRFTSKDSSNRVFYGDWHRAS